MIDGNQLLALLAVGAICTVATAFCFIAIRDRWERKHAGPAPSATARATGPVVKHEQTQPIDPSRFRQPHTVVMHPPAALYESMPDAPHRRAHRRRRAG